MAQKPKSDLKESVEAELVKMLASTDEPSEGRMKLLKLATGFLAVQNKLEESEYGSFFNDEPGNASGIQAEPEGQKSVSRRRAARRNGSGESDLLGSETP